MRFRPGRAGLVSLSFTLLAALLLWAACAVRADSPAVVINEILYHPAHDEDARQYLELFNRSESAVDVSGWTLTKGIQFTFPAKTIIRPRGFLVVCRDLKEFQKRYGADLPALGNFSGQFKHGGDKIELADSAKKTVEAFKFLDRAPWPAGADGFLASLERICPEAPADRPQNWAASKWMAMRRAPGTPGRVNDNYSAQPLPDISDVRWQRVKPGEPMAVSATISNGSGVKAATLLYRACKPGRESAELEIPLKLSSGDAKSGRYEGVIPAQPEATLLRFRLKAAAENGSTRLAPAPTEPRKAFSWYVFTPQEPGRIPIGFIINVAKPERGGQKFGPSAPEPTGPGANAFVYIPPEGPVEVFDFIHVRPRSGGWKVHFLKDQMLNGMSAINLIFEDSPRWVLAEPLAYELYRRAGVLTEQSGHVRLTIDGQKLGYYLLVEQPNKTFLARSQRNDRGNLYKLLWYERGIEAQHEKKTNPTTGHGDIVALIGNLGKKSGEAQWKLIGEEFNVDEVASYYAVNMCIQNWDGFFNNYFAYHDLRTGGKWEIIPWDEDKTWGEYDGGPGDYSWYEMPLTMGMKGDQAPRSFLNRGPFGGPGWWRPPGWFSGPLLANPEFRKKCLARTRELCETVFTEEKFMPVINSMEQRLRDEVRIRARSIGQDEKQALQEFDANIDSFRRQLVNRRKFLLKQLK